MRFHTTIEALQPLHFERNDKKKPDIHFVNPHGIIFCNGSGKKSLIFLDDRDSYCMNLMKSMAYTQPVFHWHFLSGFQPI